MTEQEATISTPDHHDQSDLHDKKMESMATEQDMNKKSSFSEPELGKTDTFLVQGDDQLLNSNSKATENGGEAEIEPEDKDPPVIIEDLTPLVPDGGYGWVVVFASFMVHFLIGGIERSAGLLYLQFLDRYEGSAAVTAWLTAIASGIRLMLGPLTGALSHRYSCRAVVMWGGVITCLSMVISGVSPSLPFQFFSFGVLGGLGRSFAYCPAVVIVGYYFNKKRGRAVGIATSGVGFGTFVIPNIIELAFGYYGFFGAFLIIAGIIFNLSICGILMRPLTAHRRIQSIQKRNKEKLLAADVEINLIPKQNGESNLPVKHKRGDEGLYDSVDFTIPVLKNNEKIRKNNSFSNLKKRLSSAVTFTKQKQNIPDSKPKQKKKLFEFSLLKDYRFACFCIAIMLFTIAFQSAFVFLPPYVKQIGGGNMKAAFSIVIAGVFDGVGRITAGFVLDLKRTRPYRYYVYNGIMLVIGSISMIIPSLTSFLPLAIVCGIYGFLTGSYISQKSVVIVDLLGPEKLTFSFGIMILFQGIGMLIGPVVGGILKDVNGTYDYAFYFGGASMLLGFIILVTSNIIHYISNKK